MNLADLLTRQARANPDALAVIHGDRRLSYAALEDLVWGLCRHLRDAGLGDGDVVGLHLHDPLLLMAAVLALARTGMVSVTLPTDPADDRFAGEPAGAHDGARRRRRRNRSRLGPA